MKVIYRAYDGTIFEDAMECADYEKQGNYKMWDGAGHIAKDPSVAYVIYLDNNHSADKFMADCEAADDHEGLESGDIGWYYWDLDSYRYIPYELMNTLKNILLEENK